MFSLSSYPYSSSRQVILGQQGAVATSQSLAALAGMEMFWRGGNAIDAAVAMAIALTVVEPTSNGIGGDGFALVWDGQLHGLNASGRSPQAWRAEQFAPGSPLPQVGWLTVTVPGAVSGWVALWRRWGKLPFQQLFAPALHYASHGFPISPITAHLWQRAEPIYLHLEEEQFRPFQQIFFPHQRAPQAGELWVSPAHAQTLESIAASEGESFYRGDLAEQIATFATQTGGALTLADLSAHTAEWVKPIATDYRGITVWELPPNSQGISTLMALKLLEQIDLGAMPRESIDSYHYQIEAMKLALDDAYRHIAEPEQMQIDPESLLDPAYLRSRQQLIGSKARPYQGFHLPQGGTVYLAAADQELMVSLIQSNYQSFGSGVLVPGTGIALHNRGRGFNLTAGHPNQIGGGKRPFHTLMPGFLTQAGQPLAAFGLMGGPMQPQGHLQMVINLVDYHLNPQALLDAPRWQVMEDGQVLLEEAVSGAIVSSLQERGHRAKRTTDSYRFGKGQMILKQQGVFMVATEPRADGLALAY